MAWQKVAEMKIRNGSRNGREVLIPAWKLREMGVSPDDSLELYYDSKSHPGAIRMEIRSPQKTEAKV